MALRRDRVLLSLVSAGGLLLLAGLTFRQSREYVDSETLWRATIQKNPASFIAHGNLGYFLDKSGDWDGATREFRRAIAINADDWEAHYNLGNAYAERSLSDDAIAEYEAAVANNPGWAPAYLNLANTCLKTGRISEALGWYQKALEKDPRHSEAHDNYGVALLQTGKQAEAMDQFRRALELNPANVQAHINYGKGLVKTGRAREGLGEWQKAAELDPRSVEAWNNLAWVRATHPDATIRDGAAAIEYARRANQLAGENPVTLGTLAAAYASAGKFSEAMAAGRRGFDLATMQGNRRLADLLEAQMANYRRSAPFIDNSLANTVEGVGH